jgi:hypothetical protein
MIRQTQWWPIAASFLPYMGLALYDGWMHEKARRVPTVEQGLHAVLALSILALVGGIAMHTPAVAWVALGVFVVASLVDEFGFHRELARRERGVHVAAWAAMALFVAVAYGRGALT